MNKILKELPKLVLFDLDGTLIEFHRDYLFSQTHFLLQEMGFSEVAQVVLNEAFAEFDYFRFVAAESRDAFIERFWSLFDWDNFPEPKPLDGVCDTLSTLVSANIDVSIVTSRFMAVEDLESMLRQTGILQYVSRIRARPGDHVHWTDKRGLISEACQAFGIAPSQAVMVGDIPTDISSARYVGIGTSIAVLSGGVRRDVLELARPDLVLESVKDLSSAMGLV